MGFVVSYVMQSRSRPRVLGRIGRALLLAVTVSLFLAQPAGANPRYAALVVDAKTGETLFERYADEPRYPASLTKMMTLYLVFEELEAGRLTLDSKLKISAYAASRPPTKLGLPAGATIRVEDAIRALAVRSANDISVAVAENISGSVDAFAQRMTSTARAIGMRKTTFKNPNGLPDSQQKTTARDMALLARALKDRFPRYFDFFDTRSFAYRGKRYRNTNRLLGRVKGMDGIKTGYTRASGFNLVSHVERDGREIVAVVMGGRSANSRNAHMVELINNHLSKASRGRRSAPLVAMNLMAPAPMPRGRPGTEASVAVAAPVVPEPAAVPEPDLVAAADVHPDAAQRPPVALAAHTTPAPRPAAEGDATEGPQEVDPIAMRIARANEVAELAYTTSRLSDDETIAKLAEMAEAGVPVQPSQASAEAQPQDAEPLPGGWHVQIAAVPDKKGAQALLERARQRAAGLLDSADPYTERVEAKGTVFYRARFVGFSGKDEARAVCAKLKRKSVDCLALPN
jgi:D-alanyl-D-alanine carboxypeptidase